MARLWGFLRYNPRKNEGNADSRHMKAETQKPPLGESQRRFWRYRGEGKWFTNPLLFAITMGAQQAAGEVILSHSQGNNPRIEMVLGMAGIGCFFGGVGGFVGQMLFDAIFRRNKDNNALPA